MGLLTELRRFDRGTGREINRWRLNGSSEVMFKETSRCAFGVEDAVVSPDAIARAHNVVFGAGTPWVADFTVFGIS
jgi:hypothetical protein